MAIDEARCNDCAGCIDLAFTVGSEIGADLGDAIPANAHVRPNARCAGPVDELTSSDQ
jgi:hypothetical protein